MRRARPSPGPAEPPPPCSAGHLISPVDLIPDFIPIIGYADDAIIVALALRSVIGHSGTQAIERHWPGTPDGLAAVVRLVGVKNDH